MRWTESVQRPRGMTFYELFARSIRLTGKLMESYGTMFLPYRDGFRSVASFEDALAGTVLEMRDYCEASSEKQADTQLSYLDILTLLMVAYESYEDGEDEHAAATLRQIEADLRRRWKERT